MRIAKVLAGCAGLAALAGFAHESLKADATVIRVIGSENAWGAIHQTAVDSGHDRVCVVGYQANKVHTYEVSTGRLVGTVAGSGILSLAVDDSIRRLYATQQGGGIKVVDTDTGAFLGDINPPQGGAVHDLAVDPGTHRIYMLRDGGSGDLTLMVMGPVGANPYADLGSVSTGMSGSPWSQIAVNPVAGRLYVSRGGTGVLGVFDAGSLAPVASVTVGTGNIASFTVNPATNRVYLGMGAAGVVVLDGATNGILGTIPVTGGRMACNPGTNRVYSAASNVVHVIDGGTNLAIDSITVSGEHFGAAVDLATGYLLVHAGPETTAKIHVIADPVPPPVPSDPSGLSATALSASQISLAWTDTSANESGFEIQRATGSGAYATITLTAPNATSFTDVGLADLTTYSYRVRALNASGASGFSGIASATTPDGTPPVLSAPGTANLVTDCAGTVLSITPATLGVTAVDNSGAAPAITCTPSTLAPGTTPVVCTAKDTAGNTASATVNVTVLKGPFATRILSPLEGGSENLIKAGQTVPVKIEVACAGTLVAGAEVTLDGVDLIDTLGTAIGNAVPEDSGLANDGGNQFRSVTGHHVFNLSTKGWTATSGARFRVRIRVRETGHVDTLAEVVLKNR